MGSGINPCMSCKSRCNIERAKKCKNNSWCYYRGPLPNIGISENEKRYNPTEEDLKKALLDVETLKAEIEVSKEKLNVVRIRSHNHLINYHSLKQENKRKTEKIKILKTKNKDLTGLVKNLEISKEIK